MLEISQRKENLQEFRKKLQEHIQKTREEKQLSLEELSAISGIPIKELHSLEIGTLRIFGHLNYYASCLDKKLKIELID